MAKTISLGWQGGVNLYADPRAVRDDQCVRSKNLFPTTAGVLDKRPGLYFSRRATNGTYMVLPLTFGVPDPASGYSYVAHLHRSRATLATVDHILVASSFNSENPEVWANSVIANLGAGQSNYEPVQFLNYRGNTIAIVPGMEGFYQLQPGRHAADPWLWVHVPFQQDPALLIPTQVQAIPVLPRLACVYRNRVHFTLNDPNKGNWLVAADRAMARTSVLYEYPINSVIGNDVLSINGRAFYLAQAPGEHIRAMAEVTLSQLGSAIDSVLMVLTEEGSCIFCTGEITQSSDTGAADPNGYMGTFQSHKVNYQVGAVSQASLVKTPYGYIWPSADDVWLLMGNTPIRIGTNIRPALQACPANERKYWSAAYANGIYMLQLVTAPTSLDDGIGLGPITHYKFQQWWLDLRGAPPQGAQDAKWFGPIEVENLSAGDFQVFGPILSVKEDGEEKVRSMARWTDGQFDLNVLIDHNAAGGASHDAIINQLSGAIEWASLNNYVVGDVVRPGFINAHGRVYACTTAGQSGFTEPAWNKVSGGVTADGTVVWTEILGARQYGVPVAVLGAIDTYSILTQLSSKDFTLNANSLVKLFQYATVTARKSIKSRIVGSVYANRGGSSGGSAVLEGGESGIKTGVALLDSGILSDEYSSRMLQQAEGDPLVRGESLQLVLEDGNSGYIIDETNNYIVWGVMDTGGSLLEPVVWKQAQLTSGRYTFTQLLTHIKTVMNAAQGPGPANFGSVASFFTVPTNPWTTPNPFTGGYPYNTQLAMAFTSRNGPGAILCLVHAAADDAPGGVTRYLSRSRALMALMGFDTTPFSATSFTIDPTVVTCMKWEEPLVGGVFTHASPALLNGIQSPTTLVHSNLSYAEASMTVVVKRGLPFQSSKRK